MPHSEDEAPFSGVYRCSLVFLGEMDLFLPDYSDIVFDEEIHLMLPEVDDILCILSIGTLGRTTKH